MTTIRRRHLKAEKFLIIPVMAVALIQKHYAVTRVMIQAFIAAKWGNSLANAEAMIIMSLMSGALMELW
jgi:hypothetical protein